ARRAALAGQARTHAGFRHLRLRTSVRRGRFSSSTMDSRWTVALFRRHTERHRTRAGSDRRTLPRREHRQAAHQDPLNLQELRLKEGVNAHAKIPRATFRRFPDAPPWNPRSAEARLLLQLIVGCRGHRSSRPVRMVGPRRDEHERRAFSDLAGHVRCGRPCVWLRHQILASPILTASSPVTRRLMLNVKAALFRPMAAGCVTVNPKPGSKPSLVKL